MGRRFSSLSRTFMVTSALLLAATPTVQADVKLGWLEISDSPIGHPSPLGWLMGEEPTMLDLIGAIESAAERDELSGIVIRLKDAKLTMSQIDELGAAISNLRDADKKVFVFSEGYGTGELLLASYADQAIIQSGGAVSFPGVFMQEMYLADALQWVGLKADFVQIGDYKGANETMTRSGPSDAWDENISQLLDALYAHQFQTLLRGRDLEEYQLNNALEEAWMTEADRAVDLGLLDAAVDLPEISDYFEERYGEPIVWVRNLLDNATGPSIGQDPFAIFSLLSKSPDNDPDGPAIAVLHIDAQIVDGESSPGGMTSGASVGSRTVRNALEEILANDDYKGLVLRIESPGGSAIASEIIWQGIRRVAEHKPVWVSVGSMAASGGYYIAVAGDKIYVNSGSIVGSIGVVGGKISMGDLFKKLHINVVSRARGPRADMFASDRPWTDQQRQLVSQKMKQTYDLFVSRVEAGREDIDVSKTAEGRLFVGQDIIDMEMADELGGLTDCLNDLAFDLELDSYEVIHFPGPLSLEDFFEQAAKQFGGAQAPGVQALGMQVEPFASFARDLLGDDGFDAMLDAMTAMQVIRDEHVALTMPRILILSK